MSTPHRYQPWSTLALFENQTDCAVIKTFLEGEKFEARCYNDRLLQLFLFLCPPRLTWRLQVRGGDADVAAHLLNTRPPKAMERAIHCPSCGSLQVNYPQMTRKFFLPTIMLHLGIIFRIIEHECYCERCHHTWSLSDRSHLVVRRPKTFPFNDGR